MFLFNIKLSITNIGIQAVPAVLMCW